MIKQFNTVQEACDYSVQKLVEQGGRCYDVVDGDCMYGDGHGKHCAIGWFLGPDDEDLMKYEGYVRGLSQKFSGRIPQVIKDQVEIFVCLQEFHDDSHSNDRERCRKVLRDNYKIDTSAAHWQQWIDMGAE